MTGSRQLKFSSDGDGLAADEGLTRAAGDELVAQAANMSTTASKPALMRIERPNPDRVTSLADLPQELEHALLREAGCAFVVFRQAAVREQVPVAGVQKQLHTLDSPCQLARDLEVVIRR